MKTSANGRAAITQREGCVLTAYLDSVGVLTIGVGHTSAAGAPKVVKGMKITAAEADAILSRDLALFEAAVNKAVKVPLNQNEFDALVSLAFNIGAGAFKGSTVVKRLNAGDRRGAADAFLMWVKGTVKGKKVTIQGLVNRRNAERKQFLTPVKTAPEPAYPKGDVVGPCICGSWPGGPCLKCPRFGDPTPPALSAPQAKGFLASLLKLLASFFSRKGS